MEKIAIISDIHGNLEALKSVLEDIKKRDIKRIFCLGDIIDKGAHSKECLQLIKENCEIILKGNCDEFFSSDLNLDDYDEIHKERIVWNKSLLSKEDLDYLHNLPFSYEFYMSGSLVRLFHATPTKLRSSITQFDAIEDKRTLFSPSSNTLSDKYADVVIYGHIHTQYLSRLYNRTMANTGSVGHPIEIVHSEDYDSKDIETTRANYLIITGEVGSLDYNSSISFEFVRVPYDIDKELNNDKEMLEKDKYVKELKNGKFRNEIQIKESYKKIKED